MVFLPRGTITPLEDPPIIQPFPGLDTLRRQTHWFIAQSPTDIILVPTQKIAAPGGGWNLTDLPPRPTQTFKLIWQMGFVDGVVPAQDGQNRRYDYVILGEWDATLKDGDYFTTGADDTFQKWVVTGLQPWNGYEVKAGILSYGKAPQRG